MILAISRTVFELQRRTIPHFNPLKKSFWPFEMHFHPRSYRFSDILQNMCPIVFAPDFSTFLCVREGKKSKNNKKKSFWKRFAPSGIWTRISQLEVRYTYLIATESLLSHILKFYVQLIHKNHLKNWKISKNLVTTYFEIEILINFW